MKLDVRKQAVLEYPSWGFRPGTPCLPTPINFLFINGGLGDYVAWQQALLWLAEKCPWVQGRLVTADYFIELGNYWLRDTDWEVWPYSRLQDSSQNGIPIRGPLNLAHESLNATGAHLITCGFSYFTCQSPIPAGWDSYPRFTPGTLTLPSVELPKKFCVLTTGQTGPSRRVKPQYWNPIIDHVIARGFTPVFVGKRVVECGNGKPITTEFSEEVNYGKGIDLRDKTTLLEVAAIIERASFVVGHDNGLLHLAGCTNTPIIFGYNIASPEHRRPHRAVDKIYDVTLNHADLQCNWCQSQTNFLIGYVFHECFYRDLKCLDLLFEKEGWRWKQKIDQCLIENNL